MAWIKRLIITRRTLNGKRGYGTTPVDPFLDYYILTENSVTIFTETSDGLVTEDAP